MSDTMGFTDSAPRPPEPPGAPPPEASAPTHEQQPVLRIVLVGVAVVMVAAALVAGILGLDARAAADDERVRARTLAKQEQRHEDVRTEAVATRHDVVERTLTLLTKVEELGVAFDNSVTAQNRFADAVNHGIDVFNRGDVGGGEALFRTDVAAALTELTQRRDELHTALAAVHEARTDLEEILR
jgi:hypothetical protein